MKNSIRIIFILIISVFINGILACEKKDSSNPGKERSLDYIDQDLSGKIGGVNWIMASGKVEVDPFDSSGIFIKFYETTNADPCNSLVGDSGSTVFTSVKGQVGEYILYLSLNGGQSQTVTLYDGETNFIASSGKIQIQELDLTSNLVKGRVVAEFDSENFVNGNFVLPYCP